MNEIDRPLVAANLKAQQNLSHVYSWLDAVGPKSLDFSGTIVFCPSVPFLAAASEYIKSKGYKMVVGSQDTPITGQGSHTGDFAISQVADFISYSIIGHSERRQNYNEDDAMLDEKVKKALSEGVTPIFCIQTETTKIPQGVEIVAYEPPANIGLGETADPQEIKNVATHIKSRGDFMVIYGGSVGPKSIATILVPDLVDGVLVGPTYGLDPQKFVKILEAAKF